MFGMAKSQTFEGFPQGGYYLFTAFVRQKALFVP